MEFNPDWTFIDYFVADYSENPNPICSEEDAFGTFLFRMDTTNSLMKLEEVKIYQGQISIFHILILTQWSILFNLFYGHIN